MDKLMDRMFDWAPIIITATLVLLCLLTIRSCVDMSNGKEALRACVGAYGNKHTVEECQKMYEAIK